MRRSSESRDVPEPPTVPPKRKLSAPRVPAVVLERQDSSRPPSDRSELALREVRAVEARAQEAIAELAGAFERQIADLQRELAERDETIRRLQRADSDALLDHETLRELVAAMGRRLSGELTTSVTAEVSRQLGASAAVEGADAGATAGRAAGSKAGAKWAPIAGFVGAALAALISTLSQRGCSADDAKPPASVQTPTARGPGYGGRF